MTNCAHESARFVFSRTARRRGESGVFLRISRLDPVIGIVMVGGGGLGGEKMRRIREEVEMLVRWRMLVLVAVH